MTLLITLYIIIAIITLLFLSYLKVKRYTELLDEFANAILSLIWPVTLALCLLGFIGFTATRIVEYFINRGKNK